MIPGSKWIVVTSIQHPTEDVKVFRFLDQIFCVLRIWQLNRGSLWLWLPIKRLLPTGITAMHISYPLKDNQVYLEALQAAFPITVTLEKTLDTFTLLATERNGFMTQTTTINLTVKERSSKVKTFTGLGLKQFDYSDSISGLCYAPQSGNFSTKLFNPYRFYGFREMWPRGFPLEYLKGHTNGKNRMISCKLLPRPAVQQGVVKADPDVDAIYRLFTKLR